MPVGRRTDIDWQAIERDFRLGQFTLRQIADKHKVSAGSISRKSEKESWVQDLSREVKEKTQAALLSNATQSNTEAVEVAVQTNVALVLEHRSDIRESRSITKAMLTELREATESREDIVEAIELETADDKNTKRRAMMLRAVALPSRSSIIVNLSSALKTLIGLERQAFNLDAPPEAQTVQVNNTTNILHVGGMSVEELEALEGALVKTIEGEKAE
jgi:hypothetical protein